MRRSTAVLIIVIIVAIVVAGVVALTVNNNSSSNNNSQPAANNSNQSSSSGADQSSTATPAAATITFDGNGFSPDTVTVKSGNTVAIKNASSQDISFNSDPHPVHTDDTDLNVGIVSPGDTKTFVVTKTGSFGYHDHLDPSFTGNIVIQ